MSTRRCSAMLRPMWERPPPTTVFCGALVALLSPSLWRSRASHDMESKKSSFVYAEGFALMAAAASSATLSLSNFFSAPSKS